MQEHTKITQKDAKALYDAFIDQLTMASDAYGGDIWEIEGIKETVIAEIEHIFDVEGGIQIDD
jgi:hypothetical protein